MAGKARCETNMIAYQRNIQIDFTDWKEIKSYIPQTTVPLQASPANDIHVCFRAPSKKRPSKDIVTWLHHLHGAAANKTPWCSIGRTPTQLLMSFAQIGDFLVCPKNNSIECIPTLETDIETLFHLLLNQVLPRLFSQQGSPVLHASSVTIADDSRAIAFVGKSGAGKSSLAAWFCRQGSSLITEDCLLIDHQTDQSPLVIPSHPSIRIWENGIKKLVPEIHVPSTFKGTGSNRKHHLRHEYFPFIFHSHPSPLSTLYLLDPHDSSKEKIELTQITKSKAISFLAANCFRLDMEDPAFLRREFHQLINLCRNISIRRLSYPKQWDTIEALRLKILNHENVKPA